MSDNLSRPLPRIECVDCDTFWTRETQKPTEIVPIAITSPIKRKGLMAGLAGLIPEYRCRACYEKDSSKGKLRNYFHDERGNRFQI